jgi:hypothetical protein
MSDEDELEALYNLPTWENALGIPIYKGMAGCPYCSLEPDQAMIDRSVEALQMVIVSTGETTTYEQAVRAVLIAALDERIRDAQGA